MRIDVCDKRKTKLSASAIDHETGKNKKREAERAPSASSSVVSHSQVSARPPIRIKPGLIRGGWRPTTCGSHRLNFKEPQQPIREQACRRTPDVQQAP